MNDVGTPQMMPPPPPAPSGGVRKKWPSKSQALILIGSGILLGIGGCFAFLSTLESQVSMLFGGLFFVGLILVLVGFVEVMVLLFRALRTPEK